MGETRSGYHHGDLREALILAALEMLEAGESFSLRAVARSAGVSTAAPYRHFADRDELESALAVHGLRELRREVSGAVGAGTAWAVSDPAGGGPTGIRAGSAERGAGSAADIPGPDLTAVAVAYVRFALRRPELFRLMFGRPCDDRDDERVRAAAALHEFIEAIVREAVPHADPAALATAGWSIAHGLAMLHLDGKLENTDPETIDARVRAAVSAVFPATDVARGAESSAAAPVPPAPDATAANASEVRA
ncbi:TetR/AcrR family transcriptional regulator [Leucobacter zeae]|nr:TetR/AcrR family transcriptional regulator [Leucobacter zeae]